VIKVFLNRAFQNDFVTLGILKIEDIPTPFFTLENPWKFNKRNISCIPPGTYKCEPFSGTKFKNVYEVGGVPQRSYILFHVGCTTEDTRGCILLGLSTGDIQGEPAVLRSRRAINKFRAIIGNNDFVLTINQG